jgi:hypothetical protein
MKTIHFVNNVISLGHTNIFTVLTASLSDVSISALPLASHGRAVGLHFGCLHFLLDT